LKRHRVASATWPSSPSDVLKAPDLTKLFLSTDFADFRRFVTAEAFVLISENLRNLWINRFDTSSCRILSARIRDIRGTSFTF
jgi:hypothetical protein